MESNTSLNSSSERFIPLRGSSFGSLQISHKLPRPVSLSCRDYCRKFTKNDSGVNYMQYFYKKSQYKDLLINTLFRSPRRVLYFSPEQKARKENDKNEGGNDWPVKARRKPLITSPEYVCDLALADTCLDWTRQSLDWGSSSSIGVIHKRCVYTYNPDKDITFQTLIVGEDVGHCLKWCNDGKQLAVSLREGEFGIWDLEKGKMWRRGGHLSKFSKGEVSHIATTNGFFVTAHKNGMLQIWDHNLFPVELKFRAHKGTILSAKISCNGKYLATNGTDSFVRIWSLPHCEKILEAQCEYPVTTIDWHPWKAPLLALGRSSKNSFSTLLNVNWLSDQYKFNPFDFSDVRVDCLAFNPVSAELVSAIWLDHPTEDSKFSHNIVVQSNLNTIVDDINFHSGRTMYLLWDKEGKRLATIGTDENLAVWKFFGKEQKKKVAVMKKDANLFREGVIR
ncbi:cell division cycle 20.2, cofactor of APC complex-like [Coccinella septempunctata]|uniref:cell division cycle 20.2, cofactor of APC complex-like n=1 Tax=Coccinella septempunctata TaxID=41139 RepID=UPI001D083A02|nr:cell division cycle 20.2, cofactor of APC complex-like [Coccinella septempunctata]